MPEKLHVPVLKEALGFLVMSLAQRSRQFSSKWRREIVKIPIQAGRREHEEVCRLEKYAFWSSYRHPNRCNVPDIREIFMRTLLE